MRINRKSLSDPNFSGVLAWYRDKNGAQKKITQGQTNPKRLTHLYATKSSAERAVEREFERLGSDSG